MGMANWVVGKMVDAFIAQPAAEKAAVFDTMATKFWAAATPEEIAQISELLLPRFMEHFLQAAGTDQKLEMMRSLVSADALGEHLGALLPDLLSAAIAKMSPEELQKLLPMPTGGMPGMPGPAMPGRASSEKPSPGQPKRPPPPSPGGMLPW